MSSSANRQRNEAFRGSVVAHKKVRVNNLHRWFEFTRWWFGNPRYAIDAGQYFSPWEIP